MAKQRFGKIRHIWTNKALYLRLRLRLYIVSVCSILTYGSEAWNMTETVYKKVNGSNIVMFNVITGKTTREEAVETTCRGDLYLQPSEGDTCEAPAVAGPHPEAR